MGCALSAPTWTGPVTDHFNGTRFFTPNGPPRAGGFDDLDGLAAFLKWQRESKAFLALPENRFCACGCGRVADMVDHVAEPDDGGGAGAGG